VRHSVPLGRIAFVLLSATAACDPYWRVVVTASLARSLPTQCVASALDTITHSPHIIEEAVHYPPKGAHGTLFWLGGATPYGTVKQIEYPDSSAALETQVGRIPGRRYNRAEADTLGREMGEALLRVRDACGGSGLPGLPSYRVKRAPL